MIRTAVRSDVRDTRQLAKAHLHLHLEGSARPGTVAELAARAGVSYEVPTTFGGFGEFEAAYVEMLGFIGAPDDLVRICRELIADEAAQGVRYTQPTFAPGFYAARFRMSEGEVFELMRDALVGAAAEHGIEVGFLLAGIWSLPVEPVEAAARFAAERADEGVVALGLVGVEPRSGYEPWARACAIAREAGLLTVPHAR